MSQKAQTTQDTSSGTSSNSKKKRGRPPKSEYKNEYTKGSEAPTTTQQTQTDEPEIPENVLDNLDKLETTVAAARMSGNNEVLVTPKILHSLLLEKYKGDPMMIYKNVALYDYTKVEETKKRNGMHIDEVVFGKSRTKINHESVSQRNKA